MSCGVLSGVIDAVLGYHSTIGKARPLKFERKKKFDNSPFKPMCSKPSNRRKKRHSKLKKKEISSGKKDSIMGV